MFQQMIDFFTSAFYFSGLAWTMVLLAIGIALVFGAIWLTGYWPPLRRKPGLWLVAATSALLTWTAIAFIQIPLQNWAGQALLFFWDQTTVMNWLLLTGIPQILLSGLVQEGAKLVPVVFYWWRNDRDFSPVFGLAAGAVSGAGFGIFEAIWVHNTLFASGWTFGMVATGGFMALLGFWERLFSIGFHIAASALAGYGLAKGWGWQFYLIAAFLHGLLNYSIVLVQKGLLTPTLLEVYVAVVAVVISSAALWLRWRNSDEEPDASFS